MRGLALRRIRLLAAALALAATAPLLAQAPAAPSAPDRNVYSAGGQVRPAGPVQGDYSAVGARVIVDQPIGGDAALAGGSVDLRAPVGDDVRAVGGDVSIESTIGGELFASGGNLTLTRDAVVARAAALYGGNVTLHGRIDGPLKVGAQSVTLHGEVKGDVQLTAETIELGPTARIGGALRYTSGSELKKAEGATVAGAITREDDARPSTDRSAARERPRSMGAAWGAGLFSYLALLACATVFLLLLPTFASQSAQRVRASPWAALGLGFAMLVAVPMLAVLLFVTILGIPLGVALLALYPVLLLAGFLVGVLFIAHRIPPALRQGAPAGFGRGLAWFALALLLVLLVGAIPVVGALLAGLLSLAGMGACVLELYRRRQPGRAAAPGV